MKSAFMVDLVPLKLKVIFSKRPRPFAHRTTASSQKAGIKCLVLVQHRYDY